MTLRPWRAGLLAVSCAAAACTSDDLTGIRSRGPGVQLAIVPATAYLSPGGVFTATIDAVDRHSLAADPGEIAWESDNLQVATVGADGQVTAQGTGRAVISATASGRRARLEVTVLPAPAIRTDWRLVSRGDNDVSLLDVWMASASEGWAVGSGGTILHTADGGATWSRQHTLANQTFTGVWGTDRANVYAVGTSGIVRRFDGVTWHPVPVPTGNTLLHVWGLDAANVFIAGSNVVLRYDGTGWQQMPRERAMELWGIWGTSLTDLHAVGQDGIVARWDGAMWRVVPSPFSELLLGVWGTSPSNAWAVGIRGTILRWNGSVWSMAASPIANSLFGVWGRSASEIYAVGNNGRMLRWNGATWGIVPQFATGQNLRAVRGSSEGTTVAVGWAGAVIRRGENGTWLNGAESPVLFDAAREWVVGAAGSVLRQTGAGVVREPVATTRDLHSIVQEGDGFLVVGDSGTILRQEAGGTWGLIPSGTRLALRSIWKPADGGPATIVGENGIIMRGLGSSWEFESTPTSQYLRWASGFAPGDRIAVGDEGVVIRNTGSGWFRMVTPHAIRLRAVWGSGPDNIFAAGDNGYLIRYDGARWYRLHPPVAVEWRSIWGGGPNDVYFAGDNGRILHFDGTTWRLLQVPADVMLVSLREAAIPGRLQAVGVGAVVVEGRVP